MPGYYNQQRVDNLYTPADPPAPPEPPFSGNIDDIWSASSLAYWFDAAAPFGVSGVQPTDGDVFSSGLFAMQGYVGLQAAPSGELSDGIGGGSGIIWRESDPGISGQPYLDIPLGSSARSNLTSVSVRGNVYSAAIFEFVDEDSRGIPVDHFSPISDPPQPDSEFYIVSPSGSTDAVLAINNDNIDNNVLGSGVNVVGDGNYHVYEMFSLGAANDPGLTEVYFDGVLLDSDPSGGSPNGSGPVQFGFGSFAGSDCHIKLAAYMIFAGLTLTEQQMRDRIEDTRDYIRGQYGLL